MSNVKPQMKKYSIFYVIFVLYSCCISLTIQQQNVIDLPLVDMIQLLQTKQTNLSLIYKQMILRTEKLQPQLNMYISINYTKLNDDNNYWNTMFLGVPISVKDNVDVSGFVTTAGTKSFYVWKWMPQSGTVIKKLSQNGAITFAKANLHEMAFGVTSNNAFFGPVRNPYNLDMIPGGSSGGSAVCVVVGTCAFSIGTDTAGSGRIPASLSGCVGYRPSLLRYDQEGMVPISTSRDTLSILTRTVPDVMYIDTVLTGTSTLQFTLDQPLRIGVPRKYFFENLDSEVAIVIETALKKLQSDPRIELIEVDLNLDFEEMKKRGNVIKGWEMMRVLSSYLYQRNSTKTVIDVTDMIVGKGERNAFASQLNSTTATTAVDYREAMLWVHSITSDFTSYFGTNDLDGMVYPTTPIPARLISKAEVLVETYVRNVAITSVVGFPSISIPAGLTQNEQLPVGIEFASKFNNDQKVFQMSSIAEEILGSLPKPPIIL
jgi:Asp-tRNA(Asn)/Glu-tRNA(Gln) amidotransferase A subunit family amidase